MMKEILTISLFFLFSQCSVPFGKYVSNCRTPYNTPEVILIVEKNGNFEYYFAEIKTYIKGKWQKINNCYILTSNDLKEQAHIIDGDTLKINVYKQTNNLDLDIVRIKGRKAFFVDSSGKANKKCKLIKLK